MRILIKGGGVVGVTTAYQLLNNASGICYALTYLVMFSIPLLAKEEKPSGWVRAAAASGFLMTLLYVVLSVFPIITVPNAGRFTFKVSGVIVGTNALGALLFWRTKARRAEPLTAFRPAVD